MEVQKESVTTFVPGVHDQVYLNIKDTDLEKLLAKLEETNFVENISVKECIFNHLGSIALAYNVASGGEVVGNIFDDISAGGLILGDDELLDIDDINTYQSQNAGKEKKSDEFEDFDEEST